MYLQFLFLYEVGLTEVKENDFQDTPHGNKAKKLNYKKPSYEKMRKTQNEWTSSSKIGEYYILGWNSHFRDKSGILELEISHPAQP